MTHSDRAVMLARLAEIYGGVVNRQLASAESALTIERQLAAYGYEIVPISVTVPATIGTLEPLGEVARKIVSGMTVRGARP